MAFGIVELTTATHKKLFHQLPKQIYKGDNNWICPLEIDIENIFSPQKNALFKDGDAKRWLVLQNGSVVGRIGAFYNRKKAQANDYPTGGVGFFEAINEPQVAQLLFDTARQWLQQQGLEAMDGPINFGENYNYWGLLVDGFAPQAYGMQYHKPYYKALFEQYGFRLYYRQFTFHLQPKDFPERVWRLAKRQANNPVYRFEHFSFARRTYFEHALTDAFNAIWSEFKEDYTPIKQEEIHEFIEEAKLFIDPRYLWFAFKGELPIAFFIIIPDINQIITQLDGKLNFWNKLRFMYMLKTKKINRLRSLVIGVHPDFQRRGIEAAMFYKLHQVFEYNRIREIEFSWIGDFNPKWLSVLESLGAKRCKEHITLRYLFDPQKPFVRYPIPDFGGSKSGEKK